MKSEEKTTKVEGAVMSDGLEDTVKHPTENNSSVAEKPVKKQVDTISKASSPHLLKWSNNPVTLTKGKKKKV